eukprot:TRINITY_DN492_c1_g1_i1.p1 TRINITY_DN492_c1_g1~~TRINITY_DN492_c1_g1_i1.p1  ORF type:complete len:289 (+),score=17.27 TRINITY_DN492_c1_g1_i1:1717-2583(+)
MTERMTGKPPALCMEGNSLSLSALPHDILLNIFSRLGRQELAQVEGVCQSFQECTEEVWKTLCQRFQSPLWTFATPVDEWVARLGSGKELARRILRIEWLLVKWQKWEEREGDGENKHVTLDHAHVERLYSIFRVNKNGAAACTMLGVFLHHGRGLPTDYRNAARLFLFASDLGYGRAQINMAACFYCGLGVPRNVPSACYWLKRALDAGERLAIFNVGILNEEGEMWEDRSRWDWLAHLRWGDVDFEGGSGTGPEISEGMGPVGTKISEGVGPVGTEINEGHGPCGD